MRKTKIQMQAENPSTIETAPVVLKLKETTVSFLAEVREALFELGRYSPDRGTRAVANQDATFIGKYISGTTDGLDNLPPEGLFRNNMHISKLEKIRKALSEPEGNSDRGIMGEAVATVVHKLNGRMQDGAAQKKAGLADFKQALEKARIFTAQSGMEAGR